MEFSWELLGEIIVAPWVAYDATVNPLTRPSLGLTSGAGTEADPYVDSFTVTMEKLVERYFVVIPEFYWWNLVMQFAALPQACFLETTTAVTA